MAKVDKFTVNVFTGVLFLVLSPFLGCFSVSVFFQAIRILQRDDFNLADHAVLVGIDVSISLVLLIILVCLPLWVRDGLLNRRSGS